MATKRRSISVSVVVRIFFLTVLLNSFSSQGARLQKPHSPALKLEILRENVENSIYKLVAVLKNDSKENQIFCDNPVLETVTWTFLNQDGKGLQNVNSGHDIDYDYSPKLTEQKCHSIKPGESLKLKDTANVVQSKAGYQIKISYLFEYGPIQPGRYQVKLSAANSAYGPLDASNSHLVRELIKKNKTAEPQEKISLLAPIFFDDFASQTK